MNGPRTCEFPRGGRKGILASSLCAWGPMKNKLLYLGWDQVNGFTSLENVWKFRNQKPVVCKDWELTEHGSGLYLGMWRSCHDLWQLASILLENNHKLVHIREAEGYLNSDVSLGSSCLSKCRVEMWWKTLLGSLWGAIQWDLASKYKKSVLALLLLWYYLKVY